MNCTPDELVAFLNATMHQAGLNRWAGNPVLACLHRGVGFCFVEVRDIDESNELLKCDGAVFMGEALNIRRPTSTGKPSTNPNQYPNLAINAGLSGASSLPSGAASPAVPGLLPGAVVWGANIGVNARQQQQEQPRQNNYYQRPSYQQVLQRFLAKDESGGAGG